MSIFDTGSNSSGFGKGKDICTEEGNGKKKEVVGDGKEEELEVENIKEGGKRGEGGGHQQEVVALAAALGHQPGGGVGHKGKRAGAHHQGGGLHQASILDWSKGLGQAAQGAVQPSRVLARLTWLRLQVKTRKLLRQSV